MQDLQWRELSLVCVKQLHLETFPNKDGGFMWFEWLPAGITLSSAAQGKKQRRVKNFEGLVVYWYVTYVSLILYPQPYENSYISSSLFFFLQQKHHLRLHFGAVVFSTSCLVLVINMFSCLMRFKEISSLVCGSETGYFQPNVGKISSCFGDKTKYFWRDVATKLDVFWWDVRTFSRLVCAQNISYFLSHKPINTAFKI